VKKKIITIILSLLMAIGITGTFWGAPIAEAASGIWNSCERGRINCVYPGDCHSYTDSNNDAICDRSQSNPKLTSSSTTLSNNTLNSTNGRAGAGTTDSTTNNSQKIVADPNTNAEKTSAATISSNGSYYFTPILILIIIMYSMTWILSARKIINTMFHRKIWNTVLLISALVSALLGIVLILNIDFDTNISLPFNMLFWHVEAGIALGIVAFFHIFWHWRYFAKILNKPTQT
jgi:hypothetical protein